MIRRVRKTARAETDIRRIALWIAQDSVDAALKWCDDLDEQFMRVASMPGMGADRSDPRRGMRSVPFGNYLIFFKVERSTLVIIRVIHGARDYGRLFGKK